jgi:rare lipoprotein A
MRFISCLLFLIISSPTYSQSFTQEGVASYYADKFEGRLTASGEKYKHAKLTAAHKTLPFGTIVKVTNLENNKTVEVKINDRGPFVEGRIIDLSKSAAEQLDYVTKGLANVKIDVVNAGDGKGNSYNTNPGMPAEAAEEREFYEFNITRLNPSGFGVQIGSFREMVNLVRLADNLKASYRKKVIVKVSIINGEKYYKIIIGNESSRQKANQIKTKLIKRYPDCFIVKYQDV